MNIPTHHIAIASEQLWPHLLGLHYLRYNGGVKSVHFLHTNDKERSEEPAKRLKAIASLMLPGVEIHLHPTGSLSQAVYDAAGKIVSSHPDENWSLNCTGGTKIMLAGLLPYLENKNVRAFYREASGDWYLLDLTTLHGRQIVNSTLWREPARSGLTLPVLDLVKAQGLYPASATWVSTPSKYCDAIKVFQAGISCKWNWGRLAPLIGATQAGFAFEILFASLLKSLGAVNFESQLKLFNGGLPVQEYDVIASTGRKLVIFDLKLKNEDDKAKIDQLSRIAENRRSLGGLGGSAVAVRPSWGNSASLKAIAKAYHIELWTATDMHSIVERLARVLEIDLAAPSPEIKELQRALAEAEVDGRRIFTAIENAPRFKEVSYEERVGEINATAYHNTLRADENIQLTLVACTPWLLVYGQHTILKALHDNPAMKEYWLEAPYCQSRKTPPAY
jgi:hypothetical protein